MVDPYTVNSLINQEVWLLGSANQIVPGYIVKFIEEENVWLVSSEGSLKKRSYSEMGQVIGFFNRFGPDYQNQTYYDLVKDKFVLSGGKVNIIELPPAELDGLAVGGIFVLMNGIGVYMA